MCKFEIEISTNCPAENTLQWVNYSNSVKYLQKLVLFHINSQLELRVEKGPFLKNIYDVFPNISYHH